MKKYLILLILLFIPVTVNAETITGKFTYMPAFESPTETDFYYQDNYFNKSSKVENNNLLAMSFDLAISTFEINNTTYISKLYEDIGFKKIKTEGINDDTIGTAIATKKIGKYNVIAVAIRGGQYKTEWTNNFIVGESGNAEGFNDSSIIVNERIKEYIKNNKLKNVKLWIVGYSRAGAIANLTGVYINKHLKEYKTTEDNLYVYTFEAPAVSLENDTYDNIYNVKNINDIVTFVYPENWGFHTNGKEIKIGNDEDLILSYGILKNVNIKEEQIDEFLKEYFDWLAQNLSRKEYYNNLEEPLMNISRIFFSKSLFEREKLYYFFTKDFASSFILDFNFQNEFLTSDALDLMYNNNYLFYNLTDTIIYKLDQFRENENFLVINDDEYEILKENLYPLIKTLGPIIIKDYQDKYSFYHFKTLFKNIDKIVINHYPQNNLKIIHNMRNMRTDGNIWMYTIMLVIFITILIVYNINYEKKTK